MSYPPHSGGHVAVCAGIDAVAGIAAERTQTRHAITHAPWQETEET